MTSTQHTPGPWVAVVHQAEHLDSAEVHTKDRYLIAEVQGGDPKPDDWLARREANTHLIAAAPELLGALEALLREAPVPLADDAGIWAIRTLLTARRAIDQGAGKGRA